MKIHYKITSDENVGLQRTSRSRNMWPIRAPLKELTAYYIANKKKFAVGYSFSVRGIDMVVTKIGEKQKPGIEFSC